MPFTFAHPAIILPLTLLNKKWFSLSGLVIGSMAPDLEYFIRMQVKSHYSHTIAGIFWFDLPLALLLCFIFHNSVKTPLFYNLPASIQSRFLVFTAFNWNSYFKKNWMVIFLSIIVGILSHLLWDSFTHHTGYFVHHISVLQGSIHFFNIDIPMLKVAQHLSTLFGSIILILSFFQLSKNVIPKKSINKNYWFIVLLLFLIILAFRFIAGMTVKEYGNIIVSVISAGLLSLTLTSLFFNSENS
jgi:hypothetical protein